MMDENYIDINFGNILAELRKRAGFTVALVAHRTQINSLRIKQLEKGDVLVGVKASECVAFAQCFGIEADFLIRVAKGEIKG